MHAMYATQEKLLEATHAMQRPKLGLQEKQNTF